MKIQFTLSEKAASERFLGTRLRASALRDEPQAMLTAHGEIVLDFGVVVGQFRK